MESNPQNAADGRDGFGTEKNGANEDGTNLPRTQQETGNELGNGDVDAAARGRKSILGRLKAGKLTPKAPNPYTDSKRSARAVSQGSNRFTTSEQDRTLRRYMDEENLMAFMLVVDQKDGLEFFHVWWEAIEGVELDYSPATESYRGVYAVREYRREVKQRQMQFVRKSDYARLAGLMGCDDTEAVSWEGSWHFEGINIGFEWHISPMAGAGGVKVGWLWGLEEANASYNHRAVEAMASLVIEKCLGYGEKAMERVQVRRLQLQVSSDGRQYGYQVLVPNEAWKIGPAIKGAEFKDVAIGSIKTTLEFIPEGEYSRHLSGKLQQARNNWGGQVVLAFGVENQVQGSAMVKRAVEVFKELGLKDPEDRIISARAIYSRRNDLYGVFQVKDDEAADTLIVGMEAFRGLLGRKVWLRKDTRAEERAAIVSANRGFEKPAAQSYSAAVQKGAMSAEGMIEVAAQVCTSDKMLSVLDAWSRAEDHRQCAGEDGGCD